MHYEIEKGKVYVVGIEVSENPIRAALFGQVYPKLKWIDSIVGAERCSDTQKFEISFKGFLWFILFVLLTALAALAALYLADRPAFDELRDWFNGKVSALLTGKQSQPKPDAQAGPPDAASQAPADQTSSPAAEPAANQAGQPDQANK